MIELNALQKELKQLPKQDRLKLAHWLLDSLASETEVINSEEEEKRPLLRWAGMFSGGPGNTAHRAEEILEAEVGKIGGFGDT